MRLTLTRVAGQGLRSLVDPFDVDLPETGLVQVRGASGVGKSTFLAVPAFVLGYGPPATKLQTWHDAPLAAMIVLDDDRKHLEVGRDPKLWLEVGGGPAVKGNATAVEERLHHELRLPLDVLQLAYRRQRQGSVFLGMPDDRKKAFLAGHAGLQRALDQHLKAGAARLVGAEADAQAAETAVVGARDVLAKLTRPDVAAAQREYKGAEQALGDTGVALRTASERRDLCQNEVVTAQRRLREQRVAAVGQARTRLAALELAMATGTAVPDEAAALRAAAGDLAEVRRRWQAAIQQDQQARALQGDALGEVALLRSRRDKAQAQVELERGRLTELRGDQARLRDATCPTCAQPWPAGAAAQAAALQARIGGLEDRIRGLEAEAGLLIPIVPPYETDPMLTTWAAAERAATEARARAYGQLQAAIASAQAGGAHDLERARQALAVAEVAAQGVEVVDTTALTVAEMELQQCQGLRRAAEAALKAAAQVLATAEQSAQQYDDARGHVADLEARWRKAVGRRDEVADTHDAVRAFVGRWFDQLLGSVTDQVNLILADVPNVKHCVFGFRSEVLTKAGEVTRQAIVPYLTVDGHEIGLGELDGASGGMLSSVHLAVDLAVLQVLEARLGLRVGWLIVDEAFEGLGPRERAACMEILRRQARDRLVLMVDHMSETDGLADRYLTVTMVNGKSSIT